MILRDEAKSFMSVTFVSLMNERDAIGGGVSFFQEAGIKAQFHKSQKICNLAAMLCAFRFSFLCKINKYKNTAFARYSELSGIMFTLPVFLTLDLKPHSLCCGNEMGRDYLA